MTDQPNVERAAECDRVTDPLLEAVRDALLGSVPTNTPLDTVTKWAEVVTRDLRHRFNIGVPLGVVTSKAKEPRHGA